MLTAAAGREAVRLQHAFLSALSQRELRGGVKKRKLWKSDATDAVSKRS